MPGTSPNYGLPYQSLGDAPDGPNLGQDLADAVDTQLLRMDTVPTVTVFTASGSFSKPAGLKAVRFRVQAGGAGGGGGGSTGAAQGSVGAGGGGGEYAEALVPAAALSASTTITVGAAGAGAVAVGGTGSAGGNSSAGGHVVANGGGGGGPLNAVANGVVTGGTGGTGGGGSASSIFRVRGGDGDTGRVMNGEPIPTRGGDSHLGRGGGQGVGTASSSGRPGQLYGGGGSGGLVRPSTTGLGGSDGAAGVVIVEALF